MRILLTTLSLACFSALAASAADVTAGQSVYNKSCKTCHGVDGTANPAIAKMMNLEIKDLKSPEVQAMSDGDLKNVITAGKGKMKPVSAVSGGAVDDVVAFVRTMKK